MRPHLILMLCLVLAGPTMALELTEQQQQTLLTEAKVSYQKGLSLQPTSPADARAEFAKAAEKLNTLIQAAPPSGPLLADAATANLYAGNLGQAIAHYQMARQQLGDRKDLMVGLQKARTLRDTQAPLVETGLWVDLARYNNFLPVWQRTLIALAAWSVLWLLATGVWLTRKHLRFRWRWLAVPTLVICILTIGSVVWSLQADQGPNVVLITSNASLRSGPGELFESVVPALANGTECTLLGHREDYLHVRLISGQEGYLPRQAAVVIPSPAPWE